MKNYSYAERRNATLSIEGFNPSDFLLSLTIWKIPEKPGYGILLRYYLNRILLDRFMQVRKDGVGISTRAQVQAGKRGTTFEQSHEVGESLR